MISGVGSRGGGPGVASNFASVDCKRRGSFQATFGADPVKENGLTSRSTTAN